MDSSADQPLPSCGLVSVEWLVGLLTPNLLWAVLGFVWWTVGAFVLTTPNTYVLFKGLANGYFASWAAVGFATYGLGACADHMHKSTSSEGVTPEGVAGAASAASAASPLGLAGRARLAALVFSALVPDCD